MKYFPKLLLPFIAVCIFLFPAIAFSQTVYEDVVYLKNGSIIHGTIIEQVPNESVKIQTADKNIFVFKMDEIEKITKEEVTQPVKYKEKKGSYRSEKVSNDNIRSKGYSNVTEMSLMRSLDPSQKSNELIQTEDEELNRLREGLTFGIQTVNGYQFSRYVSAGVGLGMTLSPTLVLVPIFAQVRVCFIPKRISPFLSLECGYSYTGREVFGLYSTSRKHKGGMMGSVAAGVRIYNKPRMAINVGLAFRMQKIQIFHSDYYQSGIQYPEHYSDETLNHMGLRFGFTF